MYDAVSDAYCYPGTTVLKNRAGLRTQVQQGLGGTPSGTQP